MSITRKTEVSIYLVIWLGLIVAWNFGYPKATPLMDVIAAIVILIITRYSLRFAALRAERHQNRIN